MGKRELGNKKTPAYAVLITILNLFNKWVPVLFVSGFLPPDQRNKADMLTANKYWPQVQNVGSKTNDNHAHRRGKLFLINLRFLSIESTFQTGV